MLLIAGPTASGKSALALDLAGRIGGEIVCADSMQVYRDLSVLTARPSAGELARAQHHLFGHVDAGERYSVGRWLDEALAAIADIEARGAAPILVGGTGLYFRALTHGLAEIPAPGAAAEARARAVLAEDGIGALAREAARLDPEGAAAIGPNDRQRLLRLVAVVYGTGEQLSRLRTRTQPVLAAGRWRGVALFPETAWLNARIEARLRGMLAQGAKEEAAVLAARALDPDMPAMKALGAAEFAALARGEIGEEKAIQRTVIATRQYAKRQRTWLRNQMADWPRLDPAAPDASAQLARALGLG